MAPANRTVGAKITDSHCCSAQFLLGWVFEGTAMFDFDLQMRFWRSAIDASMYWTEASVAAASAWQNQVMAASTQASRGTTATSPNNVFSFALPQTANPWASSLAMWQSFFPAPAMPMMSPWNFFGANNGNSGAAMFPSFWPGMPQTSPQAFFSWPSTPWAMFQTPMTAMMMSAGMPYDVAVPAAKASAATMEAADAAREQFAALMSFSGADGCARRPRN